MEISREQANNFWTYSTLTGRFEFQFYASFPKIFNDTEETIEANHIIFHNDFEIRKRAMYLGYIINTWNLPDDGEVNKTIAILEAGRAYVHYLEDQHNNPTYNNPGSFWLICCHITKEVE